MQNKMRQSGSVPAQRKDQQFNADVAALLDVVEGLTRAALMIIPAHQRQRTSTDLTLMRLDRDAARRRYEKRSNHR
jgi:hypothetical protein